MAHLYFKRELKLDWRRTLVDVAKENQQVLSRLYYYGSGIKSAIDKEIYIKAQIKYITDMFLEANLVNVPIIKDYTALPANKLIAFAYSVVSTIPGIIFGRVIERLAENILLVVNTCEGILHPGNKISTLPANMICQEIKEIICIGVAYAQVLNLLKGELKIVNLPDDVEIIKEKISEIKHDLSSKFPKLMWAGSLRGLCDLYNQLLNDKNILNTKSEVASVLYNSYTFDKNIKPSVATILTELTHNKKPMKSKRIIPPGKKK